MPFHLAWKLVLTQKDWWKTLWPHLKAGQGDLKRNIQRPVHDSGYGLHEGHEEEREPHDAYQQHHNHPSHSVLHHFLLLLAPRLGVPLQANEIREVKDAPLRLCWCKNASGTKTAGPHLLKPVRHWTNIFQVHCWEQGSPQTWEIVMLKQEVGGQPLKTANHFQKRKK